MFFFYSNVRVGSVQIPIHIHGHDVDVIVFYKVTKWRHFISHWLGIDQAYVHGVPIAPVCGARKQVVPVEEVPAS